MDDEEGEYEEDDLFEIPKAKLGAGSWVSVEGNLDFSVFKILTFDFFFWFMDFLWLT